MADYCRELGFEYLGIADHSKTASYAKGLSEERIWEQHAEIEKLNQKYGKKVVILIDEYDKPITHGLEFDTVELAIKNRDIMKNFYSCLKPMDEYIRFLFITGISKFTRVSIFSDLNHLTDISLDKRYVTICGYTQQELQHYFMEGVELLATENELTVAECLDKLKDWYDGFSWDGKNFVYNPYSTLKLLDSSQFNNYWFETGTPTFLVKMLSEDWVYKVKGQKIHVQHFETFDLRKLDYKALLLQTGYWTLKKNLGDGFFEVDYPNKEVSQSFEQMLLGSYLNQGGTDTSVNIYEIRQAFQNNDLELVMKIIETMFHSLPVELFDKKGKDGKVKEVGENFYHAVIYLIFNLLGVRMKAEVVVREGRIDAVVETEKDVYLFEFKKDQSPEVAIMQIRNRNYAGKYALLNKTIHLIGVSFSLLKRGIGREDWKEEVLN